MELASSQAVSWASALRLPGVTLTPTAPYLANEVTRSGGAGATQVGLGVGQNDLAGNGAHRCRGVCPTSRRA